MYLHMLTYSPYCLAKPTMRSQDFKIKEKKKDDYKDPLEFKSKNPLNQIVPEDANEQDLVRSKILRAADKVKNGIELSAEELDFVKEHSPALYELAMQANKEREDFRKELEKCESKKQAQNIKLKKDLKYFGNMKEAARRGNTNEVLKQITFIKTIQNEFNIFKETKKYRELPDKKERDDLMPFG